MSENRLRLETSPYLLQHKDNPVHWQPWGEAAFAAAAAAGKPVLLSIGYAACHWCHVMAHESFEDPGIAALMNALFVPIKLDREERPDLDQIYQSALALLGQQGGWPLTMFLTPDGAPFWGGTYFPPTRRYGRPGFPDVLRGVADIWAREPDKIAGNVAALAAALARMAEAHTGGQITAAALDQVANRLVAAVDRVQGGFGPAPKFPQTAVLTLLWRAHRRSRRPDFGQAVTVTLTRMCQGGIYDHLGGGFARYATDDAWLVPHFEKMLYDNAQLIDLLTLVWQDTREPLFARRVAETADWVLREMIAAPAGPGSEAGFASTLDADSEGEEGRFYVWTEAEIDAVLGPDAPAFKAAYDVTPAGNWEGRTILNRSAAPDAAPDPAGEALLARLRGLLLAARAGRVRPGWDDKVLADWNGLMIAALANAGFVFRRPDWIAAAARAFGFVARHMTASDGRLRHSWRQGQARHPASLDDHAAMARAGLILHEVTGDPAPLAQALAWIEVLDRHYRDPDKGGYFTTPDDGERLILRARHAHDHATPSGNGMLAWVFAHLFALTGASRWRDAAEGLIAAFSGELERNVFPLATLMNAAETLTGAVAVVICGDRGTEATEALLDVVRGSGLPDRVLSVVAPGTALPPDHPAAGKTATAGIAYVCRGMICSAPATTPEALAAALGV